MVTSLGEQWKITTLSGASLHEAMPRLQAFLGSKQHNHPAHNPLWLYVLKDGLRHVPYALEASSNGETVGYLPLIFVRSTLFGRFLVSLPYLNTAGVFADAPDVQRGLIDQAIELSQSLRTRHLELRHEQPIDHPRFNGVRATKVHMRLALPSFPGPLWESFPAKVRNQVRKGEKSNLTVHWGGKELLEEFYFVFSTNMRDLGTPVYSKRLFEAILRYFPGQAELCIVRHQGMPVACSVLTHGQGITEVPSASSLKDFKHTSANMLMFWHLIDRAIQRGQHTFDFGRSTKDSNTYRFKKQWGATESPAVWQYCLHGQSAELRADNPRFSRLIRIWQRLPVPVTQVLGPQIVRGIP
ncbi:MAG: FemAB family PEP-CTERM system-associated protein [Zavarzinella sp.]